MEGKAVFTMEETVLKWRRWGRGGKVEEGGRKKRRRKRYTGGRGCGVKNGCGGRTVEESKGVEDEQEEEEGGVREY